MRFHDTLHLILGYSLKSKGFWLRFRFALYFLVKLLDYKSHEAMIEVFLFVLSAVKLAVLALHANNKN